MQWGQYVEFLEKLADKGKVVKAIENRPQLYDDLQDVWRAFTELNCARTTGGFAPNPISLAEIEAWLRLNGIESDETKQEYYQFIRAMDVIFLEHIIKRNKDNGNSSVKISS